MPQSPPIRSLVVNQPFSLAQACEVLSGTTRQSIDAWVQRYPANQRRSAVLAALRAAQHQNHGFVTTELMDAIAAYLGIPPLWVYEAATFYSMIETKPVGKYSISVCTNISCMLCGGCELLACVEQKLGIKVGQSTADGKFYLKPEEECLAACCGAPMMMVDHVYHENVSAERVDQILDALE